MRLPSCLGPLKKSALAERYTPSFLIVNGWQTYDIIEWIEGAWRFWKSQFSDEDNLLEQESLRFNGLLAYARNDRVDGRLGSHATFEFRDTFKARAKIKTGGAVGVDGNSADVYRGQMSMRFALNVLLWERISKQSPYWKGLSFIWLPKRSSIKGFNDMRWICKSPVLNR